MYLEDENNPLAIIITEGDYGVELPLTIYLENGEPITADDSFDLNIYNHINGELLVCKTYTGNNIQDNTILFKLTKEESALFNIYGEYVYDIEWYQNGIFLCNIVRKEEFKVAEKGKKVGAINNES